MKFLKLSFRNPIIFYIAGILNLLFNILINPVFHVTTNSNFLCGLLLMIVGLFIDLGKNRDDNIDDELELKIITIKSTYLRNVIRNICAFINEYFIKGNYLCRFYRKTGTTLVDFVDTKDKAEEYMTWYLSETDMSIKTIRITEKRATRLLKEDIEEFEYRKVTIFQELIIDPMLAFLKQPSVCYLSLGNILKFSVLVVSAISGYFYFIKNYSFIGNGSINTFYSILNESTSVISVVLITWVILTLLSGVFSIKRALKNYYLGSYTKNRNVGQQLVTLVIIPICFSQSIRSLLISLLYVMQTNGYFLP